MRWEDFRASDNIEDRHGGGGGFGIPIGRGGLGMGTIIVLGIVGWIFGIDPRILISGAEMMTGGGQTASIERQQQQRPAPRGQPADEQGRFAAAILGNTEDVWKEVMP